MEKELIETVLLTTGVVICVFFFGAFLLTSFMSKLLEQSYMKSANKKKIVANTGTKLAQKVTDWYLTRGALPFWYIFAIDCLILVFCQLMAAYLVLGGQVLVPMFWDYIILAICSLPFYYVGMKLFRSYETIVQFSQMEDLARIVCAIFVGTISVDVIKHLIPEDLLPVYPIWQEQLIMLICAVILMWSVRILAKSLYDNSSHSRNKMRLYIYGTSIQSIEAGLALRKDETEHEVVVAFIRANEKEPHVTLQGASIINPDDDIIASMMANHAETLIIPYSAYPDFCDTHRELILDLLAKKIAIHLY